MFSHSVSTSIRTPGPTPINAAYHLQEAVLLPTGYSNLVLSVTDTDAKPVAYTVSASVGAKVNALHPAPAGYVWVGFESTDAFGPGPNGGATNGYVVRCNFEAANPGSVTGAIWSSSDADVVSGMPVQEAYQALGVPTPVGNAVRQILGVTQAMFGAESDFTSMVRPFEQWAGVEVRSTPRV